MILEPIRCLKCNEKINLKKVENAASSTEDLNINCCGNLFSFDYQLNFLWAYYYTNNSNHEGDNDLYFFQNFSWSDVIYNGWFLWKGYRATNLNLELIYSKEYLDKALMKIETLLFFE